MIEIIKIRDKETREIIGIIDGAKSVIWHSVYYGCGDFEIYAVASHTNALLLREGNYTQKDESAEIGLIERVGLINNPQDGLMIVASGRFAKSILDRRHIYNLSGHTNTPTVLRGYVEAKVRALVYANAIDCDFDSARNIPILDCGEYKDYPEQIVDKDGHATQKQVSFDNLLTYTDEVLQEYKMSAKVILDEENLMLLYEVTKGEDRSAEVIFSADFDNLLSSDYSYDTTRTKNAVLIGGEGEGLDRFYSIIPSEASGLERREMWLDCSDKSKKYGEEQEYTDEEYDEILKAQGTQTLAPLIPDEKFDGELNVSGGVWRLGEDYALGDLVTIQDNTLGIFAVVRISEITETQDENGYSASVKYIYD